MKLKKGDIIYKLNRTRTPVSRQVVTRVTKTQAFAKAMNSTNDYEYKYGIEFNEGQRLRVIPKTQYSPWSYYVETEELKRKYMIHVTLTAVRNFAFETLNYDQLSRIYKITKEK